MEEVEDFFNNSVCCKAVCSSTLKKLARIRREVDDMKFDKEWFIVQKFKG